jgi:hypothetical protein
MIDVGSLVELVVAMAVPLLFVLLLAAVLDVHLKDITDVWF